VAEMIGPASATHTEATLTEAIKKTWPSGVDRPHHIVAVQVNNGAGFSFGRTLDAIVFNTWPSEGLTLHGLEIKCSRSDLRRELQDTRKFAEFAPYLDHFSIVAPKEIVSKLEIPDKWGLYHPTDDGRLRAARKPLMLHTEGRREQMDRSLAAAFARALVQRSLDGSFARDEYARGYAAGESRTAEEVARAEQNAETLRQAIAQFEEESGVRIDRWNGARIGGAVKLVLDGNVLHHRLSHAGSLRELGERMIKLAGEFEVLSAALEATDG